MTCTICTEVSQPGASTGSSRYLDVFGHCRGVLYRTDAFALIPSLGALDPSHALIVPTIHSRSMASLSSADKDELCSLISLLVDYFRSSSARHLIAFEHGTGTASPTTRPCVEHAHIHIIASRPKHLNALIRGFPSVRIPDLRSAFDIADIRRGYALLFDSIGATYLSNDPPIQSQYFRYYYSPTEDVGFVWNWRTDPRYDVVKEVAQWYSGLDKHSERVRDARISVVTNAHGEVQATNAS